MNLHSCSCSFEREACGVASRAMMHHFHRRKTTEEKRRASVALVTFGMVKGINLCNRRVISATGSTWPRATGFKQSRFSRTAKGIYPHLSSSSLMTRKLGR